MTIFSPRRAGAFACATFALLTVPAAHAAETGPATPDAIVAASPAGDWQAIPADELLVMTLAPAKDGSSRQIVIQLVPSPYSQGWVDNIRKLAKAHWWDGTSVYRVVDNWVTQWGDAEETKPLPDSLRDIPESEYITPLGKAISLSCDKAETPQALCDSYAPVAQIIDGWPLASDGTSRWPVHCYGSVGVARNLSPDTGSGAELYTVIGHAPRQLDRNVAVVGRVIEGMTYLSTLPRGKGPAGTYADPAMRVPIRSVRLASQLPEADRPAFEFMTDDSDSFAHYFALRAARHDDFYHVPAHGVDVCNVPVPIRARKTGASAE
ncbi:peptidylprolyl isomerase [Altericroceibacterium spongiae]|uniref:Peptidylprolyl isomerase n=1 Tax=Altericroceibacterium spongiae TaxID=2320269 RepID=A0A420ELW3_9SPHN|nr:peptidylprolyl isomerase [Altericroceibacterium spongiae]RKF21695.1 peptidylprolyl isomerase [Altericroceibacterium spongiae]